MYVCVFLYIQFWTREREVTEIRGKTERNPGSVEGSFISVLHLHLGPLNFFFFFLLSLYVLLFFVSLFWVTMSIQSIKNTTLV